MTLQNVNFKRYIWPIWERIYYNDTMQQWDNAKYHAICYENLSENMDAFLKKRMKWTLWMGGIQFTPDLFYRLNSNFSSSF